MKATKAQMQARIEEVLRIRLDGAEFWDVREYAREKEREPGSAWELPEGAKPLSDGQLWRYVARADKLIAESCRASRKKLLRKHLAQRRNLYAKALNQGDVRAALACKRDEAELLGLYPKPEDALRKELDMLKRMIGSETPTDGNLDGGTEGGNSPAAAATPGAGGEACPPASPG
jgi:hypothetical protein